MATILQRAIATASVLAVASSYVTWATETAEHTNRSQCVDWFNKQVGVPQGSPWCAAFVYHVGFHACGPNWPLPKTGGCAVLGEAALAKDVLVQVPRIGDVFLLWHTVDGVERFAHTGFVTGVVADGSSYTTIEGNTNIDGSRDGWGVFRRTRKPAPKDRFVRWLDLT